MDSSVNEISREQKKTLWWYLLAFFLESSCVMIIGYYGPYIFTDIAGVDYTLASICMFIVNALCTINAFIAPAQVEKTKSRMGKYRFWNAICYPIVFIGGLLMFVKSPNSILTAVVVSIGFLLPNLALNYTGPADYGCQLKISGANSKMREFLTSRYWAGTYAGYAICGLILVPMITYFGKTSEATGYCITHAILAGVAVIGALINIAICKKYDLSNVDETEEEAEKTPSFWEMLKGVIVNRPGLMVVLADIVRFTGYYLMTYLMAYQCDYVLQDPMAMSYYLTATSIAAVVGNFIAPYVAQKIGGRKKHAMIFTVVSGVFYAISGITGKTTLGLVIPLTLAYFFMSFLDTVDNVMYADAGEYYLNKTGKDTRVYLMSMYSLCIKASTALASPLFGLVLKMIDYEPGMEMTAHASTMLTGAVGFAPGICYIISIVLLIIHGVSDKEMERCIKENEEKYGSSEA